MTIRGRTISVPLLGALLLGGFLLLNAAYYLGWVHDLTTGAGTIVKARFRTAGQIHVGDNVRVDGRIEGHVKKIEALPGGRGATLTLDIAKSAGPIYRDATVALRWRTLLGSAFYVSVDRGHANTGPLGDAVVPTSRTRSQVELDDLTSVFRADARRGLQTLPGELRTTLEDPSVPARTLSTLADVSPAVRGGMRALRGQQPDRDLRRVVSGTAGLVRQLDAPDDGLRRLVAGAAATVTTTGDRDRDVEQILAQGPVVTSTVRATMARLQTTLTGADGLVDRLDRSASDVGPTLRALHPTLTSTGRLLTRARPLVRALRPAVSSLARTGRVGVPLLDALEPSLRRLDDTILPYLGRKDPGTGYSTTVMIGGTAAGFGGSAGQMDQNGHFIRFPATGGSKSPYLACNSSLIDPAQPKKLACDEFAKALETYLNYLPPGPGAGGARKGGGHR